MMTRGKFSLLGVIGIVVSSGGCVGDMILRANPPSPAGLDLWTKLRARAENYYELRVKGEVKEQWEFLDPYYRAGKPLDPWFSERSEQAHTEIRKSVALHSIKRAPNLDTLLGITECEIQIWDASGNTRVLTENLTWIWWEGNWFIAKPPGGRT